MSESSLPPHPESQSPDTPSPVLRPSVARPLIIGIAGGTASGKSTVARKVVEGLAKGRPERAITFLDQDSYYRDLSDVPLEVRREFNWDHPDAYDVDLLVEQLNALREGRAVEKPVYSFSDYAREPRTVNVRPGEAVVLEGILVLQLEQLRRCLDVKVFVDADDDVRVVRRLIRDVKERGRDFDSVVSQYMRTVRPMHHAFVEPSKRYADIVIPHGGNNEIAIGMLVSALRDRLERTSRQNGPA